MKTAQDLIDQALELEIQAAGLRLDAVTVEMANAPSECYFIERAKADAALERMHQLIKQRSPAHVARMTQDVESAL